MAKLALLFCCLAALALPTTARADLPSPGQSSVDPCVVLCPAGDLILHVVVRNAVGNVKPGAQVDLDFSACPGFQLCAPNGSEPYTHLSGPGVEVLRMTSDAQGAAAFPVRAGGSCPAGSIIVRANGVPLAIRALASPDQNGDGIVGAQDIALLQSRLGTTDPTGDLDCDAVVSNADLAILQSHLGHACSLRTPSRPGTWGRIKMLYR